MTIAYSYCRFSTPRQMLGESLRRQVNKTRAYCEANGLTLDEGLRLSDLGVSAFRGRNAKLGALSEFIKAVESGKIPKGSVLIVESLDRLTREDLDLALELFMGIIRAGIDIVTLTPERRHTKGDLKNLVGLIEPIVILSRANEESSTKSERIAHNWEKQRTTARSGGNIGKRHPWWLEFKNNQYLRIADRVALVKRIFDLKENGAGVHTIVKRLNEDPTLPKPRYASCWNLCSVTGILKARTVMGEYQPHKIVEGKRIPEGEPIENYFPRVIEQDQYYKVQASFINPRKGRAVVHGPTNIFQGLLYNGNDNSVVWVFGHSVPFKGKMLRYHYLKSSAASSNLPGADRTFIKYESMEKAFLTHVDDLKPSDFVKGDSAIHQEISETTGRIAHLDHEIRKVKERIKELEDNEHYYALFDDLNTDRKLAVSKLEELKSQASNHDIDAVGEIQTLACLLRSKEGKEANDLREQIRARIRHLICKIVILPTMDAKRGRAGKALYKCLAMIYYRDLTWRMICFDQEGDLIPPGNSGRYSQEDLDKEYRAAGGDPRDLMSPVIEAKIAEKEAEIEASVKKFREDIRYLYKEGLEADMEVAVDVYRENLKKLQEDE